VLELAILGLLKEQPLHGYELKKRLGDTLGFLWGVSYGSLYPALRRLEQAGDIASVAPDVPRAVPVATGSITGDLAAARLRAVADRVTAGRRTRKAYQITQQGEVLLVELLQDGDARNDDEKGFALKLAFCRHLPDGPRLLLLERRREALRVRLEQTGRGERTLRSQDRYTLSLLEHRAHSTRRDLEWLDELIEAERVATAGTEVAGPHHPDLLDRPDLNDPDALHSGVQEGATA
jgi:DNA-binding PadR family transcriptional regulator